MTTTKTSDAAAKKSVTQLQRAIVDGLEDVKAADIQVFNTEALSPLFERVIVASGTSNRQTKALAASVREKVKDAGFPKPRVEGEDNGEWIIVDCGAAVVHIMQPAIRQYYRLEDLWGEMPVRLKLGAAKPAPRTAKAAATPAVAKLKAKPQSKPQSKPAAKAPARAPAAKKSAAPSAPVAKKAAAKKTPAKAPVAKAPAAKKRVLKVGAPAAAKKATGAPKAPASQRAAPPKAGAAARKSPSRKA